MYGAAEEVVGELLRVMVEGKHAAQVESIARDLASAVERVVA
jgi:hypothetical protein